MYPIKYLKQLICILFILKISLETQHSGAQSHSQQIFSIENVKETYKHNKKYS